MYNYLAVYYRPRLCHYHLQPTNILFDTHIYNYLQCQPFLREKSDEHVLNGLTTYYFLLNKEMHFT